MYDIFFTDLRKPNHDVYEAFAEDLDEYDYKLYEQDYYLLAA